MATGSFSVEQLAALNPTHVFKDFSETQALLKVMSGGRLLKLHVGDTNHLVLLGSDNFSCDWKNRAVAVNYRDRQDKDGDGDVVSLEMQ